MSYRRSGRASIIFKFAIICVAAVVCLFTACDNLSDGGGTISVSFSAGEGGGTPPSSRNIRYDSDFILPGQGNMSAPGDGFVFVGWKCDITVWGSSHSNENVYSPVNSNNETIPAGKTVRFIPNLSEDNSSCTFTAVWDNPDILKISAGAIPGVTPPVTGASPVTSIDAEQYTGIIEWSPNVSDTFAVYTAYTATITLTPKTGFKLAGVNENFFTVAGASYVTNNADSGVVTAVFPMTATVVVSERTIPGVTPPVTGATPVVSINAEQYTGTIEWSPSVSGSFAGSTMYTATITLTPKEGYYLSTYMDSNFFAVAESLSVTSSRNYLYEVAEVTATFPTTDAVVSQKAIPGVNVPVNDGTPVTTIDSEQYTGTIEWSPSVSGSFAASTVYTAAITLTPKEGYTFTTIGSDFFTVTGSSSVTNNENSGVVTAIFPETDPDGAILRFYWINEHGELASTDNGTVLSKSDADIMVVSANDDEPYTNHRWYVNGVEDKSHAGETTYTFSSSIREVRAYTLTLVVQNSGEYLNTTFNIRVVE